MSDRAKTGIVLLIVGVLFGTALWIAFQLVPGISKTIDPEIAISGHPAGVHFVEGVTYSISEDGVVLATNGANAEPEPLMDVGLGLVRMAGTQDTLFISFENVGGQAYLVSHQPGATVGNAAGPNGPRRQLPIAASALLGLPDGRLIIGGLDGSIRELDGDELSDRLPTWVRFLRHDRSREIAVAISSDGSRFEIDLSDDGIKLASMRPAEGVNEFSLHLPVSETEKEPPKFGAEFRDCDACPLMVPLEGGSFVMGSPEDEVGRDPDEGPQREVSIKPFAIGKFEVTFAEWDQCVADEYCKPIDDDAGWGRSDRPVMNVSWQDITVDSVEERGFLAWMNSQVGGDVYRLPSEAEWEYAARAGTTTRYAFGDDLVAEQANYAGNFKGGRTSVVGAYQANDFGLHDMHGNVWEWVQDCGHGSYDSAPTDGSAWMHAEGGDCDGAVLRGGSWGLATELLRSASRDISGRAVRYLSVGFRLARTLPGG